MRTHSISEAGLDLIKTFEGFRAQPIALEGRGWVVGYSHVRIAEAGAPMSETEAAELLKLDLAPVERFVNSVVTATITQSQFDALASFCFSVGQTAFEKSDVLRKVNAGQIVPAACAMDAWRKSSVSGESEIFEVLIRRRAAEKALFLRDPPALGAPSVFMRAEQDHAASILGAPLAYGEQPEVGAAPKPKVQVAPQPAQRLTEILKSEPATTLVLTHIVTGDENDGELTTANHRPVARKIEAGFEPVMVTAKKTLFGKPAETIGLMALLTFGLALTTLSMLSMFGGANHEGDVLNGLVLAGPGVIASVAAAYGLWRGPVVRPA